VLDVGGQAAPVFRLGDILSRGQEASHGLGNHIAVTGSGNDVIGWLVDHIARTSVPKDSASPRCRASSAPWHRVGSRRSVDQHDLSAP
jgi:hypothetical protein